MNSKHKLNTLNRKELAEITMRMTEALNELTAREVGHRGALAQAVVWQHIAAWALAGTIKIGSDTGMSPKELHDVVTETLEISERMYDGIEATLVHYDKEKRH